MLIIEKMWIFCQCMVQYSVSSLSPVYLRVLSQLRACCSSNVLDSFESSSSNVTKISTDGLTIFEP